MRLSNSVLIVSSIVAMVKASPYYGSVYGEPKLPSVSFPCGDDIPNWVANIGIGTPRQTMPLLLDTSSSATWVAGVQCPSNFCTTRQCSLFDAGKSSTITNYYVEETFRYEEGSVDTTLYSDNLYVDNFEFEDFEFGKAFEVHGFNKYSTYAGILGLGDDSEFEFVKRADEPEGRKSRKKSNHGENSKIAERASLRGGSDRVAKNERGVSDERQCRFTIGLDESIQGDIAWLDFPTCDYGPSPYWKAKLKCVEIGDLITLGFDKTVALFDTSVQNIQVPHKDIAIIHQGLAAQYNQQSNQYEFPCCNAKELKFSFEKYDVTLPVKAWTRQVGEDTCTDIFEVREPSQFEDNNTWRLGTKFMINFVTILDREERRTGLALIADNANDGLKIKANMQTPSDAY
ncbi:aspartic peptidase domain-containing protein [Parasitella parasitica]|nr:aspartic peptidase domain-containing protein [Parasitella parasitica]